MSGTDENISQTFIFDRENNLYVVKPGLGSYLTSKFNHPDINEDSRWNYMKKYGEFPKETLVTKSISQWNKKMKENEKFSKEHPTKYYSHELDKSLHKK